MSFKRGGRSKEFATQLLYYRKTEKCDCKKLYEGDEDFLLRIGGSFDLKNQTRSVHLISYSLLLEFTLHFLHNGQTMNSFYHAHFAKCQFKFGMEENQIMTLVCRKKATVPVPEGLLLLMSNLSASTSTTNLFQVSILKENHFVHNQSL